MIDSSNAGIARLLPAPKQLAKGKSQIFLGRLSSHSAPSQGPDRYHGRDQKLNPFPRFAAFMMAGIMISRKTQRAKQAGCY